MGRDPNLGSDSFKFVSRAFPCLKNVQTFRIITCLPNTNGSTPLLGLKCELRKSTSCMITCAFIQHKEIHLLTGVMAAEWKKQATGMTAGNLVHLKSVKLNLHTSSNIVWLLWPPHMYTSEMRRSNPLFDYYSWERVPYLWTLFCFAKLCCVNILQNSVGINKIKLLQS